MKNNFLYYTIGILKDVSKALLGFYLLSFNTEISGLFFAKMSVFFVFYNLMINIDSESILESNFNKIVTNLESIFVILSVPLLLLIDNSFSFYCLLFMLFNYGDLYFRTYLIESKNFKLINKKKLIEFLFLVFIFLLFLANKLTLNIVLLLFVSSSGFSSWFFKAKYSIIYQRFSFINSKSNYKSFFKSRSISLLVKQIIGHMDILLIGATMSFSIAGEYKLLKSFGNAVTMISTLVIEKLRQKYIRDAKTFKQTLLLYFALLAFGSFFGLFIFFTVNLSIDYFANIININKIKPIFILFSALISVSGIYRIYYLYKDSMIWNLFSQFGVLFLLVYFYFMVPNSLYPFLIFPQLVALIFFTIHIKKSNA